MHRPSNARHHGWIRIGVISCGLAILLAASLAGSDDPASNLSSKPTKANYELAARWTSSKVAKMVFDIAVTPHWLESATASGTPTKIAAGRKFYVVDPAKKTKSFVFDAVKLAASLTTATGLPYDSQHLPITTIRFVKNDGSIQFEINVPQRCRDPGREEDQRTLPPPMPQQQNDEAGGGRAAAAVGGRGGGGFGAGSRPQSEATRLRV